MLSPRERGEGQGWLGAEAGGTFLALHVMFSRITVTTSTFEVGGRTSASPEKKRKKKNSDNTTLPAEMKKGRRFTKRVSASPATFEIWSLIKKNRRRCNG